MQLWSRETSDSDRLVHASPRGAGSRKVLDGQFQQIHLAIHDSLPIQRGFPNGAEHARGSHGVLAVRRLASSRDNTTRIAPPTRSSAAMGLNEFWDKMLKKHGAKAAASKETGADKLKDYKFEKLLGSGTYGEVMLATHAPSRTKYAVKILKKAFLEKHKKTAMTARETAILKLTQHPNIVRLHDTFEDKDRFYMVFELASGGELFDRIVAKGKFTERDAAVIMATIINAVVYLHDPPNEIIHRDLKPENLVFADGSKDAPLKLVDFGIARVLDSSDDMLTTVIGSPGYTAPEILRRVPYGKAVDVYSCGVIAYTLLCGYGPFQESKNMTEMMERILRGKYKFDSPWWDPVSSLARDFVMRLMEVDPEKRLTARQCLHHKWLTDNCPPGYVDHLRQLNRRVLRAEFAALGLEMPSDVRTLPRRISVRPDHPLASLAKLPPRGSADIPLGTSPATTGSAGRPAPKIPEPTTVQSKEEQELQQAADAAKGKAGEVELKVSDSSGGEVPVIPAPVGTGPTEVVSDDSDDDGYPTDSPIGHEIEVNEDDPMDRALAAALVDDGEEGPYDPAFSMGVLDIADGRQHPESGAGPNLLGDKSATALVEALNKRRASQVPVDLLDAAMRAKLGLGEAAPEAAAATASRAE
ncbi:kinase-like domain-containing protein [Hyaloraphidium curvatum]|nr:kinase-like domain-containing protein [Hyaloraphidium curvatum]